MAGVTMAVWEKRLNLPLVVFQGAAAACTAKRMRGSGSLQSACGHALHMCGSTEWSECAYETLGFSALHSTGPWLPADLALC
jgi:hypothetical protein